MCLRLANQILKKKGEAGEMKRSIEGYSKGANVNVSIDNTSIGDGKGSDGRDG